MEHTQSESEILDDECDNCAPPHAVIYCEDANVAQGPEGDPLGAFVRLAVELLVEIDCDEQCRHHDGTT